MGKHVPPLCVLWDSWLKDIMWPSYREIAELPRKSSRPMCVKIEGVRFRSNIALLARAALYFHYRSQTVFHLCATGVNRKNSDEICHMSPSKSPRLSDAVIKPCTDEGTMIPHDAQMRQFIPKHLLQYHCVDQTSGEKENEQLEGCPYPPCASLGKRSICRIILCPPVPTPRPGPSKFDDSQKAAQSLPLEKVLATVNNSSLGQKSSPRSLHVVLGDENGCSSPVKEPEIESYITHIPMFGKAGTSASEKHDGRSPGSLNMISALAIALFRIHCTKDYKFEAIVPIKEKRQIHVLFCSSSCDWDPGFASIIRNCFHMGVDTLHVIAFKVSQRTEITRKDRHFNPRGAVGAEHRLQIRFYLFSESDEEFNEPTHFGNANISYAFYGSHKKCVDKVVEYIHSNTGITVDFWALETDYPVLAHVNTRVQAKQVLDTIPHRVTLISPKSICSAMKLSAENIVLCIPADGHYLPVNVLTKCSVLVQKNGLDEVSKGDTCGYSRGLGNVLTTAIALYTMRMCID